MESDLTALQLSEPELTDLTGIALSESVSGYLCQNPVIQDIVTGKIKQNHKTLFSLFFHEGIILFLTFILSLPLALMLTNQANFSPTSSQSLLYFSQISVIFSMLLTAGVNLWIRWKLKPLFSVIKLLEEVQKYQEVIQAVDVLDQLVAAGNLQGTMINRQEAVKALKITRESLVCALKTERVFRENEAFINQRHQLFANLEQHLTALMAFDVTNQANEYGQLLNEALEIGMSVHQAIRKL
jgi:hypothetical protein